MQKIMQELEAHAKARSRQLVQEKEQGVPLIGYNSTFIPEELIRAAGANTYYMCRGGEPEPPEAVFDSMLRFMNPLSRSLAGFNVLGLDPITPHADLVVVAQTDTHYGRISEYMEFKGVKVAKVGVPGDWKRTIALDYYAKSIRKLIDKVCDITGKSLDLGAAKENFKLTNKINAVLRQISQLRNLDNPPIGLSQFIRINHLSMLCEPAFFLEKAEALYAVLKDAAGKFTGKPVRILAAGRAFAIGDYTVIRKFEERGAVIVGEMMDEGSRAYELDVKLDGDLIENFAANRYKERVPINLFQPSWQNRFEHMQALISGCNADAVLWYQLVFDEIYDMEYSCVAKWLNEINVPFLKLESSYTYTREEMGPMLTRIESFIASIKEVN